MSHYDIEIYIVILLVFFSKWFVNPFAKLFNVNISVFVSGPIRDVSRADSTFEGWSKLVVDRLSIEKRAEKNACLGYR